MDAALNQLNAPPGIPTRSHEDLQRAFEQWGWPVAQLPCVGTWHVGTSLGTSRRRPWRGLITEWDLHSVAHDLLVSGSFRLSSCARVLPALPGHVLAARSGPTCAGAP